MCHALCDLGASASVMPKRLYDMLDLKSIDSCSLGARLVESYIKKPIGKIDDILTVSLWFRSCTLCVWLVQDRKSGALQKDGQRSPHKYTKYGFHRAYY